VNEDNAAKLHNSSTEPDISVPPHVDHRVCLHDFVSLDEGAVGCTICYWVWEVTEPLE
jgi:hypothetical protein